MRAGKAKKNMPTPQESKKPLDKADIAEAQKIKDGEMQQLRTAGTMIRQVQAVSTDIVTVANAIHQDIRNHKLDSATTSLCAMAQLLGRVQGYMAGINNSDGLRVAKTLEAVAKACLAESGEAVEQPTKGGDVATAPTIK